MRSLVSSAVLTLALLLPLGAAEAQGAAPASLRASSAEYASLALVQPMPAVTADAPAALAVDPYQHGTRKEGSVLMIVGLVGVVVGLVADEPVITILSAGVGGLGLYFYLR